MRCLNAVSTRLLLAACLSPAFAVAEPAPSNLIANISGRTTINLDGTWNSIMDPYETGLRMRFYQNAKARDKRDLAEYNFDTSEKLKVPGDWNTQRDTLLFYEGPVWYQRYFAYAKRPHTRVFLYFGAANYATRVWLNGQKVGEHTGGFTPFNFEVTGIISEGENSVVVEVDNTRQTAGVPARDTDWWNYGGLTRSVELVEVPETFIQNYFVQLAKELARRHCGMGAAQRSVTLRQSNHRNSRSTPQAVV